MTVRAEEVASVADWCRLTMRGIKLPNKDSIFGKSDPYFTIARIREDNKWQQVCMRSCFIFHTPHRCVYALVFAVFLARMLGGANQCLLYPEQRYGR